ncbi:MAG: hypothetical protein Q9160_004551 [Pyrenula sp. 1 TL-2023]
MDPASAINLFRSITGIADVVLKTANRLSFLQTKYRQANASVSLLIGQLYTIQATLKQLTSLASLGFEGTNGLSNCVDGIRMLLASLNERLYSVERQTIEELNTRGTISFLWREQEINEQRTLLEEEESVRVLRLARECTDSLFTIDASSNHLKNKLMSIFSQGSSNLSTWFNFDYDLLGTRACLASFKNNFLSLIHEKANRQNVPANNDDTNISCSVSVNAELEKTQVASVDIFKRSVAKEELLSQNTSSDAALGWINKTATSKGSSALRLRPLRLFSQSSPPLKQRRNTGNTLQVATDATSHVKTLVPGASTSGKSTLLKAIELRADGDFTPKDCAAIKNTVFQKMVGGMKDILGAMEILEISLDGITRKPHVHVIFQQSPAVQYPRMPIPVKNALKTLWTDSGVQEAYSYRRYYHLSENLAY